MWKPACKMHSLLHIFVIIFLINQSQANTRASFGEACDKNNRCDSRSSLSCSLVGLCQCIKPEEMTYDEKRGKCVVLSGERCSYTAVEIMDTTTTQEKRWTERLDCVLNANCNTDGYCDCNSQYFETSEGLCLEKGLNGVNCSSNEECRTDKNLVCSEWKCSCNETEAVFDSTYNECSARVGYSGMKYNRCVPNAYSPKRTRGQGYYEPDAEMCRCNSGYKKSKSGFCLTNYGMVCNVISAPCAEEWACLNGKCTCLFPNHQLYSQQKQECVSYVRGPCLEQVHDEDQSEEVVSMPCILNSECRNDTGVYECLCKDGFIESESRQCHIAYGNACEDRVPPVTLPCDKMAKLACRNGKCSCADFQVYDESSQKCRGLVGSTCELDDDLSCVDRAVCKSYRDSALKKGVCKCSRPSEITMDRNCVEVKEVENVDEVIEATTPTESLPNELV